MLFWKCAVKLHVEFLLDRCYTPYSKSRNLLTCILYTILDLYISIYYQ